MGINGLLFFMGYQWSVLIGPVSLIRPQWVAMVRSHNVAMFCPHRVAIVRPQCLAMVHPHNVGMVSHQWVAIVHPHRVSMVHPHMVSIP